MKTTVFVPDEDVAAATNVVVAAMRAGGVERTLASYMAMLCVAITMLQDDGADRAQIDIIYARMANYMERGRLARLES